jgi:hypothetical protein
LVKLTIFAPYSFIPARLISRTRQFVRWMLSWLDAELKKKVSSVSFYGASLRWARLARDRLAHFSTAPQLVRATAAGVRHKGRLKRP